MSSSQDERGPEMSGERSDQDLTINLFEQANDGIFIATPESYYTDVNPSGCKLTGYTRAELMQMRPADLLHPDDLRDQPFPVEAMQAGQRVIIERRVIRKDGSVVHVEINGQILSDGRWLAIYRDITERKKHEEQMQKAQERLYHTLNHLVEGCQIIDPEWRYLYVNDTVLHQTQKKREELLGKIIYDVFPGFEKLPIFSIMQSCMAERKAKAFVNRFEYLDGKVGWFELSIEPVPEGLFILSVDISQRKLSDAAREQMTHELEYRIETRTADLTDLYNNAPCGYHSLDENGIFVRINDTELHWLGYKREEVVGKMQALDLLTLESREIFRDKFGIFKRTGVLQNVELEFVRKDGSVLPVLINSTAIYNDDGQFVMSRSTVMDHTAMRRIARQLQNSNQELELFSYSVSHDLRSPLRAVDGWIQALKEEHSAELSDTILEYLNRIEAEAQHMSGLIASLMELARIQSSDMIVREINLSQMASDIINRIMQFQVERSPKIEWQIDTTLLAEADPQLMEIALTNLLENAVKYSSRKEKAQIRFFSFEEQRRRWFSICDNGAGFDPRRATKLFTPFQRLHSTAEFKGSGIGLATVKRIIHRHGGEIRAKSEPGEGACFEFTLQTSL